MILHLADLVELDEVQVIKVSTKAIRRLPLAVPPILREEKARVRDEAELLTFEAHNSRNVCLFVDSN